MSFSFGLALLGLLATAAQDDTDPTPWALRPIADPPPPVVRDADWPAGDVDRYLLARMEAAGVEPGADAAPHALLRRLTFALTGLPPTAEELDAFAADPAPAAYAAAVERLLGSPHFGERFGRHWLDVARFAESSGGGRSLMFPDAWRYRDYVIDSFNADVPFDRFVLEQLAGDLLPAEDDAQRNRQQIATGFLVLGPTNYEQQDKELLRLDVVDEQIDTSGRAFLGQTFGCARCHDHMFDPFSTREYYALAGVFGSTEVLTPGNVSGWTQAELAGAATDAWHAHERAVEELRAELAALSASARTERSIDRAQLAGLTFDDAEATLIGAWKLSTAVPGYLDAGYLHDEDQDKGEKSVTFAPDLPAAGLYEVRLSFTTGSNRATNVPVVVEGADGRSEHIVNQRSAPPHGAFVSLGRHRFARGMSGVITIATTGTDGHVIADALQLIPIEQLPAPPRAEQIEAAQVAELRVRLKALEERAPPRPPLAMAARDVGAPHDEPVRIRGSARSFGELAPRGAPGLCGLASPLIESVESGRLQLARWIVAPANPLTTRVYVNRIWHHLFGAGLTRTTDNFGAMGEVPSHPELLDHLATRFAREGWSTKALVRALVHSHAYRLAAGAPPECDPEGRLLSRYPRRRLDADALRDALLAVSGELDLTRGGATIRKLTPYDYGYEFDTLRRSVYVPRFRNAVLDVFELFDGANPNLVTGRRTQSQIPTQALFLLNSPWVQARARAAAARLCAEGAPAERLERVYLACLGRAPTAEERALCTSALQSGDPAAWERIVHALFGSLDFRYLD